MRNSKIYNNGERIKGYVSVCLSGIRISEGLFCCIITEVDGDGEEKWKNYRRKEI